LHIELAPHPFPGRAGGDSPVYTEPASAKIHRIY
jgi:hypothetical protein